jgi:hypothetical protein
MVLVGIFLPLPPCSPLMGMIAVADKLIPVVPDTGTEKAARLNNEITGNPGRWVRLDCEHLRHVQHAVEEGQVLECPTCPPSTVGALSSHRVQHLPDIPPSAG